MPTLPCFIKGDFTNELIKHCCNAGSAAHSSQPTALDYDARLSSQSLYRVGKIRRAASAAVIVLAGKR
jgi:hypothetical protein